MSVRRLDETVDPKAPALVRAAFGIDPVVLVPIDTATRFARLRAAFLEDAAWVSSVDELVERPSFRDIVALGSEAVPLLLKDLQQPHAPWVAWSTALRKILGQGPEIPDDEAGYRDKVIARWNQWQPPTS